MTNTDTRQIDIGYGLSATIDEADWHLVQPYKWYRLKKKSKTGEKFYAQAQVKVKGQKSVCLLMHRLVLGLTAFAEKGDHIDGDGLNNTRLNLRSSTNAQNLCNQMPRVGGSSDFKGVTKRSKKWEAQIQVLGKKIMLGKFVDEVEAARAYDLAAVRLHGEFALTNVSCGLLPALCEVVPFPARPIIASLPSLAA